MNSTYYKSRLSWFRETTKKYEDEGHTLMFATHPTRGSSVAQPHKVDHAFSVGLSRGMRTYAFTDKKDYDSFMSRFSRAEPADHPSTYVL